MPRYLPPLSVLLSVDNLPEGLGFVEDGINSVFSSLYFKNLHVDRSFNNEEAYYTITIVSKTRLGLDLGGEDGFALVLNPSFVDGDISEFPMSVSYHWPVLKYIKDFDPANFDFSFAQIFNLLLDISGTDKEQFLANLLYVFYPELGEDDSIEAFPTFIDDFNTNNSPITLIQFNDLGSDEADIKDILEQIQTNGNDFNIFEVIFSNYFTSDDDFGTVTEKLENFFSTFLGSFTIDNLQEFLLPKFSASLDSLLVALEFPRTWLKPVDPVTFEVIEDEDIKSQLRYDIGSLAFSTENGIEFNQADSFDLTPSQIGNTGLIIDIDELKFDFRTDRNIPEATADGRPDEFRGIYADKIGIILPKKWFDNVDNSTLQIAGYNMLIGTGGVSGTVALETVNGTPNTNDDYMPVNIGNWELGFKSFDMSFKQNAVIESNIEGRLKIPKLKDGDGNEALIEINGHLNEEGDFNLTASEPQGIPLSLFDFMTINFLTLELGRQEDNFYVGTSCEISFQNAIMERVLGDQKIVIPKLRVYDDGSIEIVGGNAFIPTNISLNLGPIEIAVTGIHFGSHQQEKNGVMRKYNYWGFDGAISLDPLGIDARGEGIKYYYTTDNDEHGGDGDSFLRIQTIEVDLIIPGTADPDSALAIINGMLSIPEPGESPEYEGKIGLKLPKARISGAAQMRLQPKEPAFIIEAGIEMPTPIPLAATGLAFYGFGGLLGYKYVAEKEAIGLVSGEDTWYDYYTYPQRGVNLDKFSGPPRTDQYNLPVAVGAGTVLGTMHDDGFLFSTRLMAILSLPSVFILDGRANVLGERLGILDNTEPPFFAGVAVGDNSFEFWFGADYKLPQSNGWIIDLYAEVQAGFFFNNPSAWYLNFGTKQSPITARVLTIITAQSFLMLSARGIEAGARVDLSLKKNFFGIKVEISAYVEVGGFISFERFQLGGYIAFGGTISISVWKIVGFRVSLDAILSAEAAKPFLLFAQIRVRVCIRIIVKICKTFKVKLKWEKNKQVDRTPIPALSDGSNPNYPDRTREAVQGVHMMTNETFELNYFPNVPSANSIDKVIPLDTYIDFKAMKGLVPGAVSNKIGGHTGGANNFIDLIPPNKVVRGGHELRQVKHKYSIENIEIKMWNGSSWQDYHPFEAVVPAAERDSVDHLRIGYWQRNGDQYDAIRLLATNPFSYMEAGEPGWFIPEEYGITPSELYCVTTQETGDCSDFLLKPLGAKYYRPNGYVGHYIDGAYYSIEEGGGDFEKTVYVLNTQWTIPLSDSNGEYDEAYFDRIRLRKNGSNTFPNIGVNVNIYTQENGVATNLTEISQQYLTGINTILSDNGGEEINDLKIKKVTVVDGNLVVDVQVESDVPFPSPDSDVMFFSNLYLARTRSSGGGNSVQGSVSLSSKIVLTETDDSGPAGCMEVTDVENNHDYQQSLQFSNADRLIIILPEASVTTDLKLTTYAEGVTIRYYKTILSDTNSTPQYEEIHEVYKTKAELNSVVSYTNEDELTSKITVTPKSANADLIREVREQIAELQEATYDSETGQIIPLTQAQQAQLLALQAELARLEAEGCSITTQSTPKKRIIAQIYNEIDNDGIDEYRFRVFNEECEIVLSSSTRYESKEAAISELKTSVKAILEDTESIQVKESVDRRYYFNIINSKGEVIARRIEYFGTEKQCKNEIKALKLLLSTSTMEIGEEGCGTTKKRSTILTATEAATLIENPECKKDKVLCNFYEALKSELFACINYRAKRPFEDNWNCFLKMVENIRNFDRENPQYQLLKILGADIDRLLKYPETTRLPLLETAEKYASTILDKIFELGDCGCDGNGDCNKDEKLCSFQEMLKRELFACINYNARDLFFDNWDCFLKMVDNIQHFDADNPQYRLLQALGADIDRLIRYPQVARPPILDTAINYANTILDKMYELGDCDCSGSGSGDCEKDPIICEAYDELVRIFNECFVPIETSEQVDASLDCFQEFRGIIKQLSNTEGVVLPLSVNEEYNNYVRIYLLIRDLVGHHEQILRFRDLKNSAIRLMELIEEAGNCDCNDGGPIEEPHICNTSIQEVCWLSVEKFEYNETIPGLDAIEQEQEDMEEAVQRTAQPIWRPNSKFYVRYQLKDEVDNGENEKLFDYYYGFKTAGPIGHFHNADGVTYGNEYDGANNIKNRADANGNLTETGNLTNPDSYPLTSLRQYIDYDRSYPNADGSLLQAKPVFYGQEQCRITLYFTKPLTYHMLRSWESYLGAPELTGSMHIAIKDPVSNVVIPYPLPIDYDEETVPLPEGNGEGGVPWINDDDPRIPLNIRMLNNFINYINENDDAIQCTFTIGNAIKPQSYAYSVTLTNLKPQKLYTALIYNAFETASNDIVSSEQVHNYVFQTSRYKNFGEQVNSYTLVDENDTDNTRQAVFNVALPEVTSDNIATAYNIVVGNNDTDSDAIETQYLDVFDRVLEGVLGMTPLDPPTNTEFNKILDNDGNIIAMLIRNPEPFNIPKIPIEKINGTEEIFEENSTDGQRGAIRVINTANDQDDPAYKVLYSKDYSQALIMHQSQQITATNLSFRFRYLIWNGSEYVIDDTVRVDDITIA
ncbi:hypothetical protein [Kordia sp.]|uniref:hypothetical protein n=1 Tax=Kordia sp. TaxID=1965332 RepID=UPI003B5ACA7C